MRDVPLPGTLVRSDIELGDLWSRLMGPDGFGQRTVWLLLLDEDDRMLPVLSPIEGMPPRPDRQLADNLGYIVDTLCADGTAASAAFLLSRPGSSHLTESDRAWATALIGLPRSASRRWAVHLATRGVVRAFGPDDLIAAA